MSKQPKMYNSALNMKHVRFSAKKYLIPSVFMVCLLLLHGISKALPFNMAEENILRPRGQYYDLASDGTYLYMACKRGVEIYSLDDPGNPAYMTTILTSGLANGVALNPPFLYVGDVYGFNIWNIADPLHPFRMGGFTRYRSEGYQERLIYRNGYVFAAAYSSGLQIIDVSDPFHPVIVGEEDTSGYAWDLAVCGDAMFVMDFFSMSIVDVSRPEIPVTANVMETMFASGMAVENSLGYLGYIEGLMILDLSDPFHPEILSDIGPTGGGTAESVTVSGDYAAVAHASYVEIYDVSVPTDPIQISFFYPPGHPRKVMIEGEYLYTILDDNGFLVTDISDPYHPVSGPHVNPGIWGSRQDVVLDGSILYLCDWDRGLVIYDVSDPADIRELCTYGTPGMLNDMVIRDNTAYLCCYSGFQIVDVSDPTDPQYIGGYTTTGHPWSVFLQDDMAFLCDLYSLSVLDISDPSNPVRRGVLYLGKDGVPYRCTVKGTLMYLADGWGGLKIISIADPSHPEVLVTWPGDTSRSYSTVWLKENALYLLDPNRGVELFDISQPLRPEPVTVFGIEDVNVADFVLVENELYLAGGTSGVFVMDVSNPRDPVLVAAADTPGNAVGITSDGTRIYVADDFDLGIYRIVSREPDTDPPVITILDPPDGSIIRDKVVVVRGNASDGRWGSGIRYMAYSTDGGETWSSGRGQSAWSFLLNGLETGWVEVSVRAVDWSGNTSSETVSRRFYLAPTGPKILMAGFNTGIDPAAGVVTISALIQDPLSPRYLKDVEIYIDGQPTGKYLDLQWESNGYFYYSKKITPDMSGDDTPIYSLVAHDHFGNPSVMWPTFKSIW